MSTKEENGEDGAGGQFSTTVVSIKKGSSFSFSFFLFPNLIFLGSFPALKLLPALEFVSVSLSLSC